MTLCESFFKYTCRNTNYLFSQTQSTYIQKALLRCTSIRISIQIHADRLAQLNINIICNRFTEDIISNDCYYYSDSDSIRRICYATTVEAMMISCVFRYRGSQIISNTDLIEF